MSIPANQPILRSAAVRAVELKADFHREIMQAASVIAGGDTAITAEHIEAAIARAAEQIVRKHSAQSELNEDARSSAA